MHVCPPSLPPFSADWGERPQEQRLCSQGQPALAPAPRTPPGTSALSPCPCAPNPPPYLTPHSHRPKAATHPRQRLFTLGGPPLRAPRTKCLAPWRALPRRAARCRVSGSLPLFVIFCFRPENPVPPCTPSLASLQFRNAPRPRHRQRRRGALRNFKEAREGMALALLCPVSRCLPPRPPAAAPAPCSSPPAAASLAPPLTPLPAPQGLPALASFLTTVPRSV